MKYASYISIILVVLSFLQGGVSYAAFPAQHNREVVLQTSDVKTEVARSLKVTGAPLSENKGEVGYGIGSFVCAMVAYILVAAAAAVGSIAVFGLAGILVVAAIVLGAMGFNKRLKGLAITGFVLGILVILPIVIAIAATAFYK